ncbi:hypothetical protein [Halorubrum sp. FL23]|uniref:hypothetical protein n=1 Tax=Halorubrum sp. FL23 TaxID=3458704 RepID=UPI0040344E7C
MVNSINRRKFGRIVGATAGLSGLSGVTTASEQEPSQDQPQADVEVRVDRSIEGGKVYSIAVARNTETGNTDATAFVRSAQSSDSIQPNSQQSEGGDVLAVSEDVVSQVETTIFDNQNEQEASTQGVSVKSDESEYTDIWGPIREATDPSGISTQQKSLLQDILEEIAAGTKDAINRVGAYFIDSPDGTECDTTVTDQNPHRQLGASVDYEKVLGDLTTEVITSALGAILGGLAASLPGAALGSVLGGLVGFAIDQLKDTTNITTAYRDIDKCAFGVCEAAIQPLVSGIWMDEDTDMLTYGSDPPLLHLEDASPPPVGYEEIVTISS